MSPPAKLPCRMSNGAIRTWYSRTASIEIGCAFACPPGVPLERNILDRPGAEPQPDSGEMARLEAERSNVERVRPADLDVLEEEPTVVRRARAVARSGGRVGKRQRGRGDGAARVVDHPPHHGRRADPLCQGRAAGR